MNSFSYDVINNINTRLKKLDLGRCYEEFGEEINGKEFFEAQIYWCDDVKFLEVNTVAEWFIELGINPNSLRISDIVYENNKQCNNTKWLVRFQQIDNEKENDIDDWNDFRHSIELVQDFINSDTYKETFKE